jgi:Queuosine biosynthesis protein QueC
VTGAERIILCGGIPSPARAKKDDLVALDLNGLEANVNLEIANVTRPLASDIPDVIADLIEIATYVYCADQAVTRGGDGVVAYGQYWRRDFKFHIPVRAPEIWSLPDVSGCLQDTLSFLSDDQYDFAFVKQPKAEPIQRYLKFEDLSSKKDGLDEVMLFSGGLDSLGGAVREAVGNRKRVALVSHRSNPKIHSKQKELVQDLERLCARKPFHIPVWVNKDKALGREHTQRARSFLFASLAFAVARLYSLDRLRFYENGVVSLNLPISEQLIGSRATRTTHPQVLKGFAKLFSTLSESTFSVENPFLWLTKAEVVNVIGDGGGAELIKHSVSCTHTLEQTKLHTHCGRCSQCISRRFAALASKYGDHDPAEMYKVDLLEGERENGIDLTLVESFIRSATKIKAMNEYEIVEQCGEVSRVLKHVEPLTADWVANNVFRLHRKHAEEVTAVMEFALASHSSEILEEKLPTTCAIILAFPGRYRVRPVATDSSEIVRLSAKRKNADRQKAGPYSGRDHKVFEVVGQRELSMRTNEEIQKRFRRELRDIWGKKNEFSLNAIRSCLNRIRRHHDLPRSHAIHKKAVK